MKIKRTTLLWVLDCLALLTFIATFTPLVIPENETAPFFMGLPYTMWMGLLVSIIFVVLAYFVSIVNKEGKNAD
ncbi:hypothetical protein [uncultured Kriegella sp.]|uniref:hypothetical protein n=1 Tax=uncultured Kriegella sp. TaxID=1798910 RepID=UPI0030D859B2|tara:strand:- start:399848 stop:400069 length:222 start_codon:yes stop_codon:yes gene_type:complete